jgi:hypothetical protein
VPASLRTTLQNMTRFKTSDEGELTEVHVVQQDSELFGYFQ